MFYAPFGLSMDTASRIYVCDSNNGAVRMIDSGGTITPFAGTYTQLAVGVAQVDGPATSTQLYVPFNTWVDTANNVYITDLGLSNIRKVTFATQIMTVFAGSRNGAQPTSSGVWGGATDGGQITSALFNTVYGIWADQFNVNMFVIDRQYSTIRRIDMASGIITRFMGKYLDGANQVNGPATSTQLNWPQSLWGDASGNVLYIVDSEN
eukprot:gene6620-8422_t